MNKYHVKPCCQELSQQLAEDDIFSLVEGSIYVPDTDLPAVFVCSDSGHGGMVKIRHCPFCGKNIVIEESKEDNPFEEASEVEAPATWSAKVETDQEDGIATLTVHKEPGISWDEVLPELKQVLKDL